MNSDVLAHRWLCHKRYPPISSSLA